VGSTKHILNGVQNSTEDLGRLQPQLPPWGHMWNLRKTDEKNSDGGTPHASTLIRVDALKSLVQQGNRIYMNMYHIPPPVCCCPWRITLRLHTTSVAFTMSCPLCAIRRASCTKPKYITYCTAARQLRTEPRPHWRHPQQIWSVVTWYLPELHAGTDDRETHRQTHTCSVLYSAVLPRKK